MTPQLAEKVIGSGKNCQGTTSVVPQVPKNHHGALQDAEKLIGAAISKAL
jgi:hypothetical protein